MRVLLSTYGSRGDVEPLAGLAVRLRELGAEVRVCAPPDPDCRARVESVGAEFVPYGWSARELAAQAAQEDKAGVPRDIPWHARRIIGAAFEVLPEAVADADLAVVTGLLPAAAAARSVAELVGVPAQYVALQKLSVPSPHHAPMAYPMHPYPPEVTDNRQLWDLFREATDALFLAALNDHRVAAGLAAVPHINDYLMGAAPWLATDPVLDPWQEPSDLPVRQTGAWLMADPNPLPADLIAFLDAGTPPVYVGFGSMVMHTSEDLPRTAVNAVRALGRRLVLKRGWAGLDLVDHQDDCFLVDEVNQHALFARVAAVVHHGGAGTTTTALKAGAAQVVVPQLADQPYFARRVAELGTGVAHDGAAPTEESLTAALRAALSPAVRSRATAVAGQVLDGAGVAAHQVLELVNRERALARS
ncbi:vancomycin aglycone glucosyltransferase [Crossiella equi]|uniref:Vancomycin aglycone glucosyltransferase n=1 Tax=Crossiella equi TaxID=130796 RepID=A0ABS5A667_9PSEU|nr:glycosyltransferase [Crossiella equi]MBP2472046.1 vancomycin aglycone glucosyltransferase [Crossiella equi]